jgi:hypothetical protein
MRTAERIVRARQKLYSAQRRALGQPRARREDPRILL